jgi:hypothetical protein
MISQSRVITLLLLGFLSAPCMGQWPAVTAATQPLTPSRIQRNLRISGLEVGKSTFSDVQRLLGEGHVFKEDGTDESPQSLCYVSALSGDSTALIFTSGSAGAWKTISQIRLVSRRPSRECARSPLVSRSITTSGLLRLGMTRQAVRRLMGVPFKSDGNSYSYRHTSVRKVRKNGRTLYVDVVAGVNLHSSADSVDEIEIYETETI